MLSVSKLCNAILRARVEFVFILTDRKFNLSNIERLIKTLGFAAIGTFLMLLRINSQSHLRREHPLGKI
jgi:hypothetical protein